MLNAILAFFLCCLIAAALGMAEMRVKRAPTKFYFWLASIITTSDVGVFL